MNNSKEIIIEMYDKQNNCYKYELLAVIEYENNNYAVMFQKNDIFNTEVEIFKMKDAKDKSATYYEPEENNYINKQVYEMFKEQYQNNYTNYISFKDKY